MRRDQTSGQTGILATDLVISVAKALRSDTVVETAATPLEVSRDGFLQGVADAERSSRLVRACRQSASGAGQ